MPAFAYALLTFYRYNDGPIENVTDPEGLIAKLQRRERDGISRRLRGSNGG